MKELSRCKECEFFNDHCPIIIEVSNDVDDGHKKYSQYKDELAHVPGCEFGDDPVAFEFMNECPLGKDYKYNIEINIDCAPGDPRPDVYFNHIWKNILGNNEDSPEPISKFFGNWKWIDIEVTEEQQTKIGEYLKECYSKGRIRYADW